MQNRAPSGFSPEQFVQRITALTTQKRSSSSKALAASSSGVSTSPLKLA
jgi:hypothetical protein